MALIATCSCTAVVHTAVKASTLFDKIVSSTAAGNGRGDLMVPDARPGQHVQRELLPTLLHCRPKTWPLFEVPCSLEMCFDSTGDAQPSSTLQIGELDG